MNPVDWEKAEKIGAVLGLPIKENIDFNYGLWRVTGSNHRIEDNITYYHNFGKNNNMEIPKNIHDSAVELMKDYGEKASFIAADRATMASYARNQHRSDFWVLVFTEIRRINSISVVSTTLPETV